MEPLVHHESRSDPLMRPSQPKENRVPIIFFKLLVALRNLRRPSSIVSFPLQVDNFYVLNLKNIPSVDS